MQDNFDGFNRVERNEFFGQMGPLDVTPYPYGSWDDEGGYLMHWKLHGTELIGLSDSIGGGRYWVRVK